MNEQGSRGRLHTVEHARTVISSRQAERAPVSHRKPQRKNRLDCTYSSTDAVSLAFRAQLGILISANLYKRLLFELRSPSFKRAELQRAIEQEA